MIWVSIILGIIQALPQIIAVIKSIIDKLHHMQGTERLAAEQEFHGILAKWHQMQHPGVEAELKNFAAKIKA